MSCNTQYNIKLYYEIIISGICSNSLYSVFFINSFTITISIKKTLKFKNIKYKTTPYIAIERDRLDLTPIKTNSHINYWLVQYNLYIFYNISTILFFMAYTAACVRSDTLIFLNMLDTWFFTVFSLIDK